MAKNILPWALVLLIGIVGIAQTNVEPTKAIPSSGGNMMVQGRHQNFEISTIPLPTWQIIGGTHSSNYQISPQNWLQSSGGCCCTYLPLIFQ